MTICSGPTPPPLDWLASFLPRPEPAGVLVIVTYRRESETRVERTCAAMRGRHWCRHLVLGGLELGATTALLTRRSARSGPAVTALAERIQALTGGHPLFIATVLEGLAREATPLAEAAGDRARADTLLVPERLRTLIDDSVDRLPPEHAALLETASAASNEEWSAAVVAAGCAQPLLETERALASLAARDLFIRHAGRRPGPMARPPSASRSGTPSIARCCGRA